MPKKKKADCAIKPRQVFVAAFSKRKQICPSGSSNPAHTAAGDAAAVVDGGDFRHANKFRSASSSCTFRVQYSDT
jgi:hypothetical protein